MSNTQNNNQSGTQTQEQSPTYNINTGQQLTYGQRMQNAARILKLVGFLLFIGIIVGWFCYMYYLFKKRGHDGDIDVLAGGWEYSYIEELMPGRNYEPGGKS